MRIGMDFDGTIALYDRVFHRAAMERHGMPEEIQAKKLSVRDWIWSTPEGKHKWITLQGIVYGTRMGEAEIAPGLESFLRLCEERSVQVSIISHKTEFPIIGPRVNLREVARRWLDQKGFHQRFGISPDKVFFEATREQKIQRIGAQRCSHFVEDLEEVFAEPGFPRGVEKLLYAPGRRTNLRGDPRVFSDWHAISDYFRELKLNS